MGERGQGGGGKISHFRLNTSSEVFRDFRGFSGIFSDFQRFSEIFRDFQSFSEIFRDFQEFNVFWGERYKKDMERGGKEEAKYQISNLRWRCCLQHQISNSPLNFKLHMSNYKH